MIEYDRHNSRDSNQILLNDDQQLLTESFVLGMKFAICDYLV